MRYAQALVVVIAIAMSSCCKRVPPVPCPDCPPVAACLKEAPPVAKPLELVGPEKGCPAAYVGCLSLQGATTLEANIRAARLWQQEAWARCGPLPVTPTVPPAPPK